MAAFVLVVTGLRKPTRRQPIAVPGHRHRDAVLGAVQWDADQPLHRGHDGTFEPFLDRFGGLLHPPVTTSG